ncbi:hypothetical protein BT69DRAFT_1291911 [Atractiella rhizophila]|nr:hypothetical protein BT69DRAFT_1291911 [Atractiella rhizophila]
MSALSSNIFDPPVVKALCKQVLETHTRQKAGNKKGNWLVDWETMWTIQSVNDTVEKWKKNKNGIPYFRESSAITQDLFNFITELRPKTDVGKLGEAIQQLHSEHVQQIKRVWQQYAIEEQIRHKWPSGSFKPTLKQFPGVLSRAADPTIKADAIKSSPSSGLIKTIYEHWIECLSLGLDATLKVAKKANIYTTMKETGGHQKVQVTNIFGGGLLTMEFLVGNSPLEMGPPLQEFAQRARLLGVDFEDFVVAFRDAILKKKADLRGGVSEYYSVEESLERLTKVEDKFKKNPDFWIKCCATFELQKGHIAKGCLIPKHQQLPFMTSNNENWHVAAGEPFRGSASSLTTVLSVLPDIFLRKNLLKVIEAGTHHIFLVDWNLRLEDILYSSSQPKLLDVFSKHEFGLVKREKQFTGVDLDRYKAKRKELLQTLKPDDIEHPEVIVMAVMNGTVVMNGELPVDSDVEMEVFPKAKPENTPLQHSAISSSCLPEKRMATQLDSEDDATTTLTISSKRPHLNRELLEPDIKPPPLPSFWNFIKSNQSPFSTKKGVPTNKIIGDGLVVKNSLFTIEKDVASHIQRVARGDSIKPFWKLQTTLPPPVKVTYMKPTKKGNLGAKQKDGYGEKNTNNHKRDVCDDNFMHWSKVPYPLPKTNLRNVPLCKNMLGKWSTDENAVKKFFTDIKDGKVPDVDQSVEMVNMRVFMAMTWVEEKMDWVLTKERLHIEVGKRK